MSKENFPDIEIEKSIPDCSRSTIKFSGADDDRLPSFSTTSNSSGKQIQYRTRTATEYITKLLSNGMISYPIITLYSSNYTKEPTTEQHKHDFISEKQCEPNESILKSPGKLGQHHSKNEYIKMASAVLNSTFDLCVGEINQDLSDHTDEVVQSQDFNYDDLYQTWFLNIGGFKTGGHEMFQTSDDVLNIDDLFRNKYGINIRFLFLLHPWSSIIDLNDDTIRKVLDYQNSMDTYFKDMESKLNKIERMPNLHDYTKFNEHDVTFHKHFSRIQHEIHLAFCDSIDTRTVLEHIRDLTSITMEYTDGDEMPNINLIKNVNSYISRTMDMFGL